MPFRSQLCREVLKPKNKLPSWIHYTVVMLAECAVHEAVRVLSAVTKGGQLGCQPVGLDLLRLFLSVNKATGNDNVHNIPKNTKRFLHVTGQIWNAKIHMKKYHLYIRMKTVTAAYKIIVQKYKSS